MLHNEVFVSQTTDNLIAKELEIVRNVFQITKHDTENPM